MLGNNGRKRVVASHDKTRRRQSNHFAPRQISIFDSDALPSLPLALAWSNFQENSLPGNGTSVWTLTSDRSKPLSSHRWLLEMTSTLQYVSRSFTSKPSSQCMKKKDSYEYNKKSRRKNRKGLSSLHVRDSNELVMEHSSCAYPQTRIRARLNHLRW